MVRVAPPSLTNGLSCDKCGMFQRHRGWQSVGRGAESQREPVYGCPNAACVEFVPATCTCGHRLDPDGTCPKSRNTGETAVEKWEGFSFKETSED